ncbi:NADH-quinone oxidoreductase subunit B family protein [Dethiobacter alkaliphilus]|uniref:NADH ubiquinone oxidoreductase 20 kDa subunit n=1 Tax=Dethiobacter alkaliphilus AHT 1 TaxID=555088 RepID=C0GED7_DETAL|nr:oxidoreductase [Dethiobacter alkaliphilus]EEG78431.1 NADH ubiquinone oxidoreductase 20 kDa subunit [Dethiobacter alkaliphilus AHT 1]
MAELPKVAIFKFASCSGCQLEFLNLEPVLLDLLGLVDLTHFVMARRENKPGPYDIGFVEGSIVNPEDIERLKQARRDCGLLVAIGACACHGGLQSLNNGTPQREVEARVYEHPAEVSSLKSYPVDEYVDIDAKLSGCPINKNELVEFVKSALLGVTPRIRPHCVCVECKLSENVCLTVSEKTPCMGPVTRAGCGALCPARSTACTGCHGPSSEANAASLREMFAELGLQKADIDRNFQKYAGLDMDLRKREGSR